MVGRRHPWDLRAVVWSDLPEFTRGVWEGKPLMSWGIAPPDRLATRRQLRAMTPPLRPGGQDPVAVLYFRCRRACKLVFANLYLISKAKPVRPMTAAKWAAVGKAVTARRTCRVCREVGYAELPKAHRTCEPCRYSLGVLAPDDYLHDYLSGTPTLDAAGHTALDDALMERRYGTVIPLRRAAAVSGVDSVRRVGVA